MSKFDAMMGGAISFLGNECDGPILMEICEREGLDPKETLIRVVGGGESHLVGTHRDLAMGIQLLRGERPDDGRWEPLTVHDIRGLSDQLMGPTGKELRFKDIIQTSVYVLGSVSKARVVWERDKRGLIATLRLVEDR